MEITIQDAIDMVRKRIRKAYITLGMLPDDHPKRLRCLTPVYLEWGRECEGTSERRPGKPTAGEFIMGFVLGALLLIC